MSDLLTVEGLSKKFGSRSVLSDVSFNVRGGEVLGLIGPNGAGKTTLFECLAGLLPANDGKVDFKGRPLSSARRKDALFYLPDAITPWAEQTVGWALKFFSRIHKQTTEQVARLSQHLRLNELKPARLSSLSKGERKRVLLALGLLTPQELLLLDEPFDGLDLRQARDVMTLVRDEARTGRTLMLSIHQLVDAGRVCDRLVLLNNGQAVAEGTLAELKAQAGLSEGGLEEIFLALT